MSKNTNLRLRAFPYPYRAAIAICNDIDDCDLDTFLKVHEFLNTAQETPLGSGLSLPVGDSFWCYSLYPQDWTYFEGLSFKIARGAAAIKEFYERGWIDCLHSFGNFSLEKDDKGRSGALFTREMAEKALEILDQQEIKVKVWINHGDPYNLQNLYSRIHAYAGDDPASVQYHADLLRAFGVQFYWHSELSPYPLDGEGYKAMLNKILLKSQHSLKNLYKNLSGNHKQVRNLKYLSNLLYPMILRDGQLLWAFTRFNRHPDGLWGRPDRTTLKYQLNSAVLKQLIERQGTIILYTHLGRPKLKADESLFNNENLQALMNLAKLYREGKILVMRTSDLLQYKLVHNNLGWSSFASEDKIITLIRNNTQDSQFNSDLLSGITFYKSVNKKVELYLLKDDSFDPKKINFESDLSNFNENLPVIKLLTKENPKDFTGQESITIC